MPKFIDTIYIDGQPLETYITNTVESAPGSSTNIVPTVLTGSSATITTSNNYYLVNASTSNMTITLPQASTYHYQLTIRRIDTSSNRVTITAFAGDIIDDTSNILLYNYESLTLISDTATTWRLV